TEGYSAPEQYRGEASPASDVYGVGATIHHILTRRDPRLEPPFTFAERPVRDSNPDVSAGFDAVIMRALSFKPEDRFPHAAAMRDALEKLQGPKFSGVAGQDAGETDVVEDDTSSEWVEEGIKPIWTFQCEDEIRSSPVVHKGVLYVGAQDNNLYAVNIDNGSFRWKYPTEHGVVSSPAVADEENLVLYGSLDHSLYAVDWRTGKLSWSVETQGPVQSSPSIMHGHVFFGSDDGRLYAVRLASGKIQWQWEGGDPIRTRPLVTGELIVVGQESGYVIGVDLAGQIVWRFKAKRAVYSSPVDHEGLVFFGSMDWHVYALDIARGWKVWALRTNKPIVSSPAYGDDRVYIGSVDGNLYAIDASSGKERWRFETEGQITSSPAYVDGVVYFGGVDKKVYSVDAKTGRLRWSYETEGKITSSPAVHDGIVYVASMDHHVYALKA
ncbi:PQQ-binding-like beta-propeller repeat protein, partial [candidate division KSB3 bacterium]|nr:PQQ-binding-like beta-propeller repeat protein [candidate division KSB3 bacterium]